MNSTLEAQIIQNIPTLSIVPADAQNYPVFFFIPGYGGTKEAECT
jgi:hypothetical protein